MRYIAIILIFLISFAAVPMASAGDIPVDNAALTANGISYEINRDATGNLYVTDWGSGEIWRVVPGTSAYVRYRGIGAPNDARPDSSGNVWLTDYYSPILTRINTSANPVTKTTWNLTAWDPARTYTLAGLAFDETGKLWFSEWDTPSTQLLYSFDPTNGQLCGYTLPGGDHSYYVLYQAPNIWLGDSTQGRIVRFNTTNRAVAYWAIGNKSEPRGLALDAGGNIWWADIGLNNLGWLNPNATTSNLKTYALPSAAPPNIATPYMVALREGKIWYAAQGDEVGTIGVLDPAATASTSSKSPVTSTAPAPTCKPIGAGTPASVTTATGTLSWSSGVWTDITPAGATGWTVYQAPGAEVPYGISADASRVWVTDQTYNKLMRAVLGGLAAPVVTISIPNGTTNVVLNWGQVANAASYRTWFSSSNPYFDPSGSPATDPNPADLSFTHTGAAASPGSYFYVVRAVAADGVTESGNSNRTGAFTFSLTKGG